MYTYKWPKFLWWLRRLLFGETWGDYMIRYKEERRTRWFERAK